MLGARRPHGAASVLSVCHGEALTSTWQARPRRLARPTLTSDSEHSSEGTGSLPVDKSSDHPRSAKLGFQEVMPVAWTADGVPLSVTNTAMSGHDCCPTDFKLHHGDIHARMLPAPQHV